MDNTASSDGPGTLSRRSASAAFETAPATFASSCDATQKQQHTDVGPSREQTHVGYSIFLSHSGEQKGFVERLYECLKNAGHDPFFDVHSIPRGSPFPDYIEQAATHAKLGVVILSDDFMLSRWPMIELKLLTDFTEIMPLFYKLSPADLKSQKKLSKWKKKWNEMAQKDSTINVNTWEKAVKLLAIQAGEVYRSGASEGEYIRKVVKAICMKLPPRVTYDVSYAKGQQRFIQEVEKRFQNALVACKPSSNTPVIGMHGVGGLGKTTLCRVLANFYMTDYSRKTAVIEFPTYKDEGSIVKECKRALKQLNCADEYILADVHSFDQVVELMKRRKRSEPVFLALDNVWEHSWEEARRILEVGFGADSKVLVTSRSKALLETLLDKVRVRPLLTVNEGEAIETFQASFGRNLSLTSKELLGRVVSLCLFNGSYHPVALKALGRRLNTMGGGNDNAIEENLKGLLAFKRWGSDLEDLIRINYDGMTSIAQRMFLDVAVIFRRTGSFVSTDRGKKHGDIYKEMCEWLSILYEGEGEFGEYKIKHEMNQLALNGLLQIEEEKESKYEDVQRKVVVHDVYVQLAERLASGSPQILVVAGDTNMEAVRWAELERVVWDFKREDAVQFLLQEDCPKLQILYASEQTFSKEEGLQLKGARALRLLKVENCIGRLTGLKAVPKLAALQLVHADASEDFEVQPEARAGFRAVQDVSSCCELKSLSLDGEAIFDGAEDNAGYFCPLTNLKYVDLRGWAGLKKLPDLTASLHLEEFWIGGSQSLEEIEGGLPPSLEYMGIKNCARLRRVQDLGWFVQLKSLEIINSGSLAEIPGVFPSNLERIRLRDCTSLQRIPDLVGLAQLWDLDVRGCGSLEEISGVFLSNLKWISLHDCTSLQRIPNLDGRAQLVDLIVSKCGSLTEISGILPSNLKRIQLLDCTRLQRIPDLDGLAQLRDLAVRGCGSLEEISGVLMSNLERILLDDCTSLQRIPNLDGRVQLRELFVSKCGSLAEISGVLPSNLEMIELHDCTSLQRIPDLDGLAQLRALFVRRCGSLEEIRGVLPSNFETIILHDCTSLQRIPNLDGMLKLETVDVQRCGSLVKDQVWGFRWEEAPFS